MKIEVPGTHVVIPKEVYEELRNQELVGQYYTLGDLQLLTGKSRSWLYENLLTNPHRLERMKSFTHVPEYKGDRWLFKATGLREYLEKEFLDILKR